ncbi:hypothetical protein [Rhodococcoides fascians]|uniref:hypothetical protein n=1 Tax=Rhodococcoides fascians TaxID=1828 RepID=UPI000A9BE668|nr:hypothetical protein [Rhodococcus fascians]
MSKSTSLTAPGLSRTKIGPTLAQKSAPKPGGNFPKGGGRKNLPATEQRVRTF